MSSIRRVITPITYEVKVPHRDFETRKIEVDLVNGTTRKFALPIYSSDKGIEGLFYVFDEFKKRLSRFTGLLPPDAYWIY
jgi:hypothetical protein